MKPAYVCSVYILEERNQKLAVSGNITCLLGLRVHWQIFYVYICIYIYIYPNYFHIWRPDHVNHVV